MSPESAPGTDPWLHVVHQRPTGHNEQWLVTEGRESMHLEAPSQPPSQVPLSGDDLDMLARLRELDRNIAVVPRDAVVRITCPPQVRDLLPLWLTPLRDGPSGLDISDEDIEYLDDRLWGVSKSTEHSVTVNDERWIVIDTNEYSERDLTNGLMAVPDAGQLWTDLADPEWASYAWTETGSMTSGFDRSMVGLLTPASVVMIDKLDEEPARLWLRRFTSKVAAVQEWISEGWLANQLRSTWSLGHDDEDFIRWGFLQVARTAGRQVVHLRGRESRQDDDLGVGLTYTSQWEFSGSLDDETWGEVLQGVSDARPGHLPR